MVSVLARLLAFVCAGVAAVPAAAQTLHKVLASPLVEEGSDPDGCTPAVSGFGGPAEWQVRIERLLPDGKALVEVSRTAERNRFTLCIADLPVAKNAAVELSFVVHGGKLAQTAAIVLRFADPQDYYAVEADALSGGLRLMRIVNGERNVMAERAAALVTGKVQTLKVTAVDEAFVVALDGRSVLEANDRTIAAPGRFGIASRADSLVSFGDLFITIPN